MVLENLGLDLPPDGSEPLYAASAKVHSETGLYFDSSCTKKNQRIRAFIYNRFFFPYVLNGILSYTY